jgi:hypothetical protein
LAGAITCIGQSSHPDACWLQKENGTLHKYCHGNPMGSDSELSALCAELLRGQVT